MLWSQRKTTLPKAEEALSGRDARLWSLAAHALSGRALEAPYPPGMAQVLFGMGCFWGAEKRFWSVNGVYVTAVGYAGGFTPHPTYEEVCSAQTGHNEVVLVVYDPAVVSFEQLLKIFWESHDPTQGMRQGNDVGTQYRSGIYVSNTEQKRAALHARHAFGEALRAAGKGAIATEILDAPTFYFAEDYHQQYLAKNPNGYCGLGGTGVCFDSKLWKG